MSMSMGVGAILRRVMEGSDDINRTALIGS